jgi:hypothetical protein
VEYAECMQMRTAYRILTGKPEGKSQVGRLGIDGRIILKCILGKESLEARIGFKWLRIVTPERVL